MVGKGLDELAGVRDAADKVASEDEIEATELDVFSVADLELDTFGVEAVLGGEDVTEAGDVVLSDATLGDDFVGHRTLFFHFVGGADEGGGEIDTDDLVEVAGEDEGGSTNGATEIEGALAVVGFELGGEFSDTEGETVCLLDGGLFVVLEVGGEGGVVEEEVLGDGASGFVGGLHLGRKDFTDGRR